MSPITLINHVIRPDLRMDPGLRVILDEAGVCVRMRQCVSFWDSVCFILGQFAHEPAPLDVRSC